MLKDCGAAAKNIIGALVEKLEESGDVTYLKVQNFQLREELAEARRKADRQKREMNDLRKTVIRLEKTINALKEGCGPFSRQPTDVLRDKELNKRSLDIRSEKNYQRRNKANTYSKIDIEIGSTPGCSSDKVYMQRSEEEWPLGPGTMEWTTTSSSMSKTRVEREIVSEIDNTNKRAHMEKLNLVNNNNDQKPRRSDIKIIANKQLVPPRDEYNNNSSNPNFNINTNEWKNITKRGKKRQTPYKTIVKFNQPPDTPDSGSSAAHNKFKRLNTGKIKSDKVAKPGNRIVKPAVVTITGKPDGATYAQILSKAKQNVSLASLGI